MHHSNLDKVLPLYNKQNYILLSKPNEVDWISLFISRDDECISYTCTESLFSSSNNVFPCAIISRVVLFLLILQIS